MSEKIVQLNEEVIKGQLKELVRGSVEETLNELLEAEAEKLTQAARYERNEQRQGYRSGHYNRNLTTTSGDVTLKVPKLKGISFETAIIADYEDAFRKALGAKRSAEVKKDLAAKKRTLQKSENRLAELDKLFKRIYEDMVNGKLSEARFQMLSDDYEQEQEELRAKIEMLENEIQNQENHVENVDRFIRVAKKHLNLEKLPPDVLNDMVQAVYVHAPDTSSGQRIQDVDISYNYIGILPANLLYDIINGKAA